MAAQLFPVVIVFSWLVLGSNTSWMTTANGWPDGFHGSLDVLFLLICSLKVAAFSGLSLLHVHPSMMSNYMNCSTKF